MKLLFIAEGATFAHTARSYVIAKTLPPSEHDVVFARIPEHAWLTREAAFESIDLECLSSQVVAARLARGSPVYDYATLNRYVEADLALLRKHKPDVVIGDFRLSLSVSARLAGCPYITICDAYWMPGHMPRAPMPVLPFTRVLPLPIARTIFDVVSPLAMRLHAHPIEKLRRHYGIPRLDHDLRRCYTDADARLFPNFRELFPDLVIGPHDAFLGPVSWSPNASDWPLPEPGDRRVAYVTMGSSGDVRVLERLVSVLEKAGYETWLASGGRSLPQLSAEHLRLFEFLPGDAACQIASLVICNGGSPTTNQALRNGKPVLGIATNMDQFLNMKAIQDHGIGILVRADSLSGSELERSIITLATESTHQLFASKLPAACSIDSTCEVLLRALTIGRSGSVREERTP